MTGIVVDEVMDVRRVRLARVMARRVPLAALLEADTPWALAAAREAWCPRRPREAVHEQGLAALGEILNRLQHDEEDRADARRHRFRTLYALADGDGAY